MDRANRKSHNLHNEAIKNESNKTIQRFFFDVDKQAKHNPNNP